MISAASADKLPAATTFCLPSGEPGAMRVMCTWPLAATASRNVANSDGSRSVATTRECNSPGPAGSSSDSANGAATSSPGAASTAGLNGSMPPSWRRMRCTAGNSPTPSRSSAPNSATGRAEA
jgi:hypothetical protein